MTVPGPLSSDTDKPRTAIVTGADSGIGRAVAAALAGGALDVGITYNSDKAGAEAAAEEVRGHGVRAAIRQLDLTDLPGSVGVIDELADELGGVDVLVNNAGMMTGLRALDVDFETWRKVLDVDLNGAFLCSQRAAHRMIEAGRGGRIIMVTSVHEHQPRVGEAPYCAGKAGAGMLAKVLALELADHGITVNCVAPGEIATPMNDSEGVDVRETRRPGLPIPRSGDAREVAAVAAFLATPAASYVTGTSWPVDGGMLNMGPQASSELQQDTWRYP